MGVVGKRLDAYDANGRVVATLVMGPRAVQLEQQCRATLFCEWPEFAAFCKGFLARSRWSADETAFVARELQRILESPGLDRLAAAAWEDVPHWGARPDEFAIVWGMVTEMFVRSARRDAWLASQEVRTDPDVLVRSEMEAGATPDAVALAAVWRTTEAHEASLAERLGRARRRKAMSVAALSRASGIGAGTISDLERGHRVRASMHQLARLASALELPLPYLLDGMAALYSRTRRRGRKFAERYLVKRGAKWEHLRRKTPPERFRFVAAYLADAIMRVQLADLLGVGIQRFNHIMAGRHQPTEELMKRLGEVAGLSPRLILAGEETGPVVRREGGFPSVRVELHRRPAGAGVESIRIEVATGTD
jgi:transcriptional regulator with XRE-family HTH domain